jgi:predicted nuclease of predicted toxin-antitoxin system
MTFWLDAQLDPKLAAWLGATFKVIAKPLSEIGLNAAEDEVVFSAARKLGQIVIMTKDYDFVELIARHGPPPQILWLSFGNMITLRMQVRLGQAFPDALELLLAGNPLVEIG